MNNKNTDRTGLVQFSLERWREGFLNTVLYITSAIGLVGILVYVFTSRTPVFTFIAIGCYLVLLAFTFLRLGYYPRAGFFLLLLNLVGLMTLLDTGIQGNAILFYLGISIVSSLIYENKSAVINTAVNVLIISVIGWLTLSNRFMLFSGEAFNGTVSTWIQSLVYYLLLAALILSGIRFLKRDFLKSQSRANSMLKSLQDQQAHLEERVSDATRNLTLAAEVGRTISQLHDLKTLLRSSVDMIRERFGLYYAQVYLLDPTGHQLVLQAGTGEVGKQLTVQQYSLPIDLASLNGSAAVGKSPVIVENTETSTIHRPNPLLPDTRSEMVVPLVVRDVVVGTLDIQSSQIGALNKESLPAFETLAGQLAVAVENANLLAETEAARAAVEMQSRRLVQAGWAEFLDAIQRGERLGYSYDLENLTPYTETVTPEGDEHTLVTPIQISGEPVGVIKFESERGWSKDEADLAATVARQLGQQVENLRLLAQTGQYRAKAEQALRRQTRQGWDDVITAHPQVETGFSYDLNTVSPLSQAGIGTDGQVITHPLQVFGENIGELSAVQAGRTQQEITEWLSLVAEQLSTRVENLRLFEQTQRSQMEVEKRARQLAVVAEVSTVSSKELEIDRMLQSVVQMTQHEFNLYHAHIFLYDEKTEALKIAACGWKEGDEHQGTQESIFIPIAQEKSLVARAARNRKAVIVNDVKNDPDWLPNPLLPATAAEMAVPLIIGEQVQGVLDVQSDQLNAFTQDDANIQTTLASQVAIALQNARSFAQAQKQAERETMLNVIGQKIRGATTVEAVLQIAARELGHALGAPLTIAQLGMKDNQ